MDKAIEQTITDFFERVNRNIKEGMRYRDAIDLAAVTVGAFLPAVVSRAVSKYQEATHPKMALSQQEDVDALAFASMGTLWHEESFEDVEEVTLEDLLAQSLYLILKYAKEEEHQASLKSVLEANRATVGDQEAREAAILAMME